MYGKSIYWEQGANCTIELILDAKEKPNTMYLLYSLRGFGYDVTQDNIMVSMNLNKLIEFAKRKIHDTVVYYNDHFFYDGKITFYIEKIGHI